MLILFIRTVILYLTLFFVIRMTGKRQVSDLQPFDLIVTLLIADLASEPAANTGIPLLYGIVPILALFLIQRGISFVSLKSEKMRGLICGHPLIVISAGIVQEQALRDSHYNISDLMEQLRGKDVFELSLVAYAILETNGNLSVLLSGEAQQPTYTALTLPPPAAKPPYLLIADGSINRTALRQSGYDENWLRKQLKSTGSSDFSVFLYAFLNVDGTLHVQTKQHSGGRVYYLQTGGSI